MENLVVSRKMLGDTIRKLRKEKGLSPSGLARLVGVSGTTVRRWEKYTEYPSVRLLPLLDQILGAENIDGDIYLYYYDYVIGGL